MRLGLVVFRLAALLVALPVHAEWATGGKSEVPLDGDGHKWIVRATLNADVEGAFLLDTGASLCVVSPSLARKLGAPLSGVEVQLQTANGMVRAPVITLRTLDVGGNRARDVTAVVHPIGAGIDGILGLSYLNNFSYAIDPRRSVLRLR